ncbi:MAG: DUF600 family protein [Clostridia bacterium]|nr:DUF600 family protein [Clostridia bacterium]
MTNLPNEKMLFSELQKKLFYIIPEKWKSIYLYASIIDVENKKTTGEMFFYYIPKGLIKKKPINGYEIPALFNIDEEEFSQLITDLYSVIKKLRIISIKTKRKRWSNINISIENNKFKAEYGYEDLKNSSYDSYERHIIWRYNYFDQDIDSLSKKDKNIINKYLEDMRFHQEVKKDYYVENIYDIPMKNIVDFEKTLTVDEAIAQSKTTVKEKKGLKDLFKKKNDESEEPKRKFENHLLKYK